MQSINPKLDLVYTGVGQASPRAIQGYDTKTGALLRQIPVLVNGQAVPVIPRITPYMVNGGRVARSREGGRRKPGGPPRVRSLPAGG